MPWFKVDDQLHSHPKARGASLSAIGLWSLCGSYSMSYKLDGFVPAWFAHGFPNGKKLAQELVRVGLWHNAIRDGEDGYQFHDWTDYQPSADEIEADREAARKRQRAHREKRRNQRSGKFEGTGSVTPLVTRDVTRDFGACHGVSHTTPSRPVPTRPALYRKSSRNSPSLVGSETSNPNSPTLRASDLGLAL